MVGGTSLPAFADELRTHLYENSGGGGAGDLGVNQRTAPIHVSGHANRREEMNRARRQPTYAAGLLR
jgi:hypothetical protein